MWCHGRDSSIEKDVVPLSTGRIFKATSNDGLSWVQEPGPGAEESTLDVNVEEWWGFDTAHVGLGDVRQGSSGKVMTLSGGVFTMYYFGGTYAKGPPGLSTDEDEKGADFRIGIALSQDGLNWSRLEGEHPSGACLEMGNAEDKDFDAKFVGWPQCVTVREKVYRLYYTAMGAEGLATTIGVATSEDSFKWTKLGQVYLGSGGGAAFDSHGVSRSHLMERDSEDEPYTMFYEGEDARGSHSIGVATSQDGIKWSVGNGGQPVLEPDTTSPWEAKSVGSPRIVDMGGGSLRLYYVGTAEDGSCSIGCAECADFKENAVFTRV